MNALRTRALEVENESLRDEHLAKTGPLTWILVLCFVYLLLIGVGTVGQGFKLSTGGKQGAQAIFEFATNPIVGVILGTFATALVQSSSTVTSVIVGMVAGGLPVSVAVPMIFGANMGTTITNTIVSLGSVKNSTDFQRAFQAATVHDFFNLYAILIFLPIEALFHPLERMGGALSHLLVDGAVIDKGRFNLVGMITKPVYKSLVALLEGFGDRLGGILAILLGIGMIILAVLQLGKLLKAVMVGRAQKVINSVIGRGPVLGILSGTLITILVQSSSTTTSLIIPLAAAGVLTLRQIYPFTLGANIGTCVTAVLAATAITENQDVALQIALVHLLYNVCGVLLFTLVPWLRMTPIWSAEALGQLTVKRKGLAFGYVALVFFGLPGLVLLGQSSLRSELPREEEAPPKELLSESPEERVE